MIVTLITDVAPQPTGTGIAVLLVLALVVAVGVVALAVLLLRRGRRQRWGSTDDLGREGGVARRLGSGGLLA